jgi:hypothetical protein
MIKLVAYNIASCLCAAVVWTSVATSSVSCTKGALPPIFTSVEQKVFADLEAGDGLPQIEADISALVPGLQSVEELTQAIITVLIDTGVLTPPALSRAQSYKLALIVTIAAHK